MQNESGAAERRRARKQKLQSQRKIKSSPIGTLKTSLFRMKRSVLQARDDANSALRLYNNLSRDHGIAGVVQLTQQTRSDLQKQLEKWTHFSEDQTRLKTQSQVSHTLARRMDFVVVNLLKIQIALVWLGYLDKVDISEQDADVGDFHDFLGDHFEEYGDPADSNIPWTVTQKVTDTLTQVVLRNASKWFPRILSMPRSSKQVIQEQGKTVIGMSKLGNNNEVKNIRWLLFVTQMDTYVNFENTSFDEEAQVLETICTELKKICPAQSRRLCFRARCVAQREVEVEDWTCPTAANMRDLKNFVDKGNIIVMHCTAGFGRTGFMISSLLFGYFKLVSTLHQCIRYLMYNYRVASAVEVAELLANPQKEHTHVYFMRLQQVYPSVKPLLKLRDFGISQHLKGKAFVSHAEEEKYTVKMTEQLRKNRKSLSESTENEHTYNTTNLTT